MKGKTIRSHFLLMALIVALILGGLQLYTLFVQSDSQVQKRIVEYFKSDNEIQVYDAFWDTSQNNEYIITLLMLANFPDEQSEVFITDFLTFSKQACTTVVTKGHSKPVSIRIIDYIEHKENKVEDVLFIQECNENE